MTAAAPQHEEGRRRISPSFRRKPDFSSAIRSLSPGYENESEVLNFTRFGRPARLPRPYHLQRHSQTPADNGPWRHGNYSSGELLSGQLAKGSYSAEYLALFGCYGETGTLRQRSSSDLKLYGIS